MFKCRQIFWIYVIAGLNLFSCTKAISSRISIKNQSPSKISNIILNGSGFSESISSLEPYYETSFPVFVNEETFINLSFQTPTKKISKEKIATIKLTDEGTNIISIVITKTFNINVSSRVDKNSKNLINLLIYGLPISLLIIFFLRYPQSKTYKETSINKLERLPKDNLKLHIINVSILIIFQCAIAIFFPSQKLFLPVIGLILYLVGIMRIARRIGTKSFLLYWRWEIFNRQEALCFIYGLPLFISIFIIEIASEINKLIRIVR